MTSTVGTGPRQSPLKKRKWPLIAASVFFLLLLVDLGVLASQWPFTKQAVIKSLQKASDARVEIGRFRGIFFPYPGCVAEDVVIHHPDDPSGQPLLTISTLTVQADYSRLVRLSKDLNFIHTDGMHIHIRAGKQKTTPSGNGELGASLRIDTLIADRTVLEFASKSAGERPFVMAIHHTRLFPVSGHQTINFETDLHIPTPPGEIHSTGQFGPWNRRDPFGTRVSGSYNFHHADLAFARAIAGILESQGAYRGSLRQIDITDSASVPDFRVPHANHPVGLTASFQATVNGETGDTILHTVSAHFRHTDVTGSGAVAAEAKGGDKTVSLILAVPRGRIDDFLYLLTQSARPGMEGHLTLRTRILLPSDSRPFLKRLRMQGPFQIAAGLFTKPSTQESLDRIRDRARGAPADNESEALSNLIGSVSAADGMARLSNITFDVPGASANLSGTYDLLSTRVDLRGMAHLDTRLSNVTTGAKSFLLKILSPFFKSKKNKGSDVPIKITGMYGETNIAIDFGKKFR